MTTRLLVPVANRLWDYVFRRMQFRLYRTPYIWGPKERLQIGERVRIANTLLNTRGGRIIIGDYVQFGHNVALLTGTHDYTEDGLGRTPLKYQERNIIVERGAWVASNAMIIGPVRIGENSVVAAGSVVIRDVPDRAIVAGNPARLVRMIGSADSEELDKNEEL